MPSVLSNMVFQGSRIRNLLAPINGDEPLRRADGSGVLSRNTITVSSADGAPMTGTLAIGQIARLINIATNNPMRLRLYTTTANQTADYARLATVDAPQGAGLLFEYITQAGLLVGDLSPVPEVYNNESTITSVIAYSFIPASATSTQCTLTYQTIQP